jgi:SpoVK/Ycf46/Vps4 family AAA+-type ATPase
LSRISEIERRDWRERAGPYSARLSALLKTEAGTQQLRLAQCAGLLECPVRGGLFMNGRVGIGKTLTAALLGTVLRAARVLFLCPGGIKKETHAHFAKLGVNWQVAPETLLESYTTVSGMPRKGESLAQLFGGLGPQVIICDEADKLKNVGPGGSALANQINDWMVAHPETIFVVLTGTCDVEGLLDYGHLLDWCLRDKSPVPRTRKELEYWSEVLDQGDMTHAQWVCQDLGIDQNSSLDEIRAAFRERLHSCPGVIIDDTPFDKVPLEVEVHVLEQPPELEAHYQKLRLFWQRPDGFDVTAAGADVAAEREPDRVQGSTIWTVARRMARGLCYTCDPRPPEPWLLARRAYFGWVRAQIEARRFLTEAVAREWAEQHNVRAWQIWRDTRDDFQPNQRTIWLSDAVLRWCEDWGASGPGVIWTEDVAFAAELSRRTGWVYYGQRGYSNDGKYIENAPRGSVVIASRIANSTGRNLQFQWNRCLFVSPVSKSRDFEQAVGRFFREGVETWADHVHADILIACAEDLGAHANMIRSARRTNGNIYSQLAARIPWPKLETPETGAAFGHLPDLDLGCAPG